jgi:hypothetical protein
MSYGIALLTSGGTQSDLNFRAGRFMGLLSITPSDGVQLPKPTGFTVSTGFATVVDAYVLQQFIIEANLGANTLTWRKTVDSPTVSSLNVIYISF